MSRKSGIWILVMDSMRKKPIQKCDDLQEFIRKSGGTNPSGTLSHLIIDKKALGRASKHGVAYYYLTGTKLPAGFEDHGHVRLRRHGATISRRFKAAEPVAAAPGIAMLLSFETGKNGTITLSEEDARAMYHKLNSVFGEGRL